ncbi:MAG: bifunctional phosphoribosylaminoimidazolecarboxamide formyltransferase/IMP cyclohydrolase [Chloroflexi bacterium]|nr:bifunctional phosphoribosylaminoimidazolecarboxamide formyltransferase/IMP cyclohydrolase [Chloroflexota bacterium]
MRAILSVSDKTGLESFARELVTMGWEIFSTGGTKKALTAARVPVHSVSDITGFPEILDGRVKTLHPAVHGGILARRDLPQHVDELARHHIEPIDMVVVNLYPFVQTVSKADVSLTEALENIDIGGPTLIRASAKNFPSVLVVVDPADYGMVAEQLRKGRVELSTRKRLAQKAFQHVALYDTAISQFLRESGDLFPADLTLGLKKHADLRYGENPHQKAALYLEQTAGKRLSGVAAATQLGGSELSFNNYLDFDAAWSVVCDFASSTVVVIKHTNPCGLASHHDLPEAYRRALAGDPLSAFGGVVGVNRIVDIATAEEIDKTHFDGVVAQDFTPEALRLLQRKKGLRILAVHQPAEAESYMDIRRIRGGLLLQTSDAFSVAEFCPRVVTKRKPTRDETRDLAFAWRAVKHIKSNAISLAKDSALVGMGAGQPSRVVSVEIALKKAGDRAKGSVLGSDAFFPFPDGVELAAKAGVTAIMQPGGSVKDEDAIKVADQYGMAMVFTGVRHFKH